MSQHGERYEKGMKILKQITDEKTFENIEQMKYIHPEFEEIMVSFGYGDLWSRSELELKQRAMITISCLLTQGSFETLHFHVRVALNVGVQPEEIIETAIHCAGYIGFPKVVKALPIIMEIFEEENIETHNYTY